MGIPSYYRKLTRSCPQLVQKRRPDGKPIQWFFMDFNCLIYHCLYRPGAPVYPVEAEKDKAIHSVWEADFIDSVLEYTLSVIREVQPEKGVYLAIDGVVPMAKMRQQRLRRFKSSWMKRANVGDKRSSVEAVTADAITATWNTNAITPGTAFMDQLHTALQTCFKEEGQPTWKISSCREWGEGEHKILAEWRKGYSGPIAIYGLDADLIILSLLGQETVGDGSAVYLFREAMDRGSVQYDPFGQECYEWFSIQELRQWLVQPYSDVGKQRSFILQYCFMMSLLGNDFLPSSLSYKMRDDGHGILLDLVYRFFDQNRFLVCADTCEIVWEGVQSFFKSLAHDEPVRIVDAVVKKQSTSYHCQTQSEFHKVGHEDWPLSHIEERVLLNGRGLHPAWKDRYLTYFFHGFPNHPRSIQRICDAYLYGVQWVWSYYMGRMDNVCFNWYYPFSLPPLWEWLVSSLVPSFPGTVHLHAWDITPTEQLALVLPIESWSLLPSCPERNLPYKAPHLFPTEFSFDSVGKRFFWECESMIPLPTMLEVKAWIS